MEQHYVIKYFVLPVGERDFLVCRIVAKMNDYFVEITALDKNLDQNDYESRFIKNGSFLNYLIVPMHIFFNYLSMISKILSLKGYNYETFLDLERNFESRFHSIRVESDSFKNNNSPVQDASNSFFGIRLAKDSDSFLLKISFYAREGNSTINIKYNLDRNSINNFMKIIFS
jgi:hypothetical protein